MVTVKETCDVSVETRFLQTYREERVIQGREELRNIKCYDTSMALLEPPSPNEVSEVNTSISGGLLSDAAKLIQVQKTVIYHVKFVRKLNSKPE